jgi:hypothetical protein
LIGYKDYDILVSFAKKPVYHNPYNLSIIYCHNIRSLFRILEVSFLNIFPVSWPQGRYLEIIPPKYGKVILYYGSK